MDFTAHDHRFTYFSSGRVYIKFNGLQIKLPNLNTYFMENRHHHYCMPNCSDLFAAIINLACLGDGRYNRSYH